MKNKPRWAFYGSSLVSSFWNGAATYYRGIIRSLAERGHQVTFYEPDAYSRQKNRDIENPPWADVHVYSPDLSGLDEALQQGSHADILVKCSGVGVLDETIEAAIADRRKPGQLLIFWDVDAPATLDRIDSKDDDPFRELIPRYDLILTYGGGDPVVKKYLSFSAKACTPIYNALDPTTHYVVKPEPQFSADLSFLGNRLPDREKRVDDFFFHAARELPQKKFVLGGSGWEERGLPEQIRYLGHVPTHQHNSFNCSSTSVLNLSRESMAKYGYSPATRVFEAAGAGACVITDHWLGIEEFLEPNREVLVVRNGAELAQIVDELTPRYASQIGQAALRRITAHHTYAHRAEKIEAVLEGYL